MSVGTNVPAKATQPGRIKRGGQAEADAIRLSDVPHTSVCGQPGNTNASKLKRDQSASAMCRTHRCAAKLKRTLLSPQRRRLLEHRRLPQRSETEKRNP